jgi:hypothetical protein
LQYKVIEHDADTKAEKALNDAIMQGWELVEFKMRRGGPKDYYVFLMRRA